MASHHLFSLLPLLREAVLELQVQVKALKIQTPVEVVEQLLQEELVAVKELVDGLMLPLKVNHLSNRRLHATLSTRC